MHVRVRGLEKPIRQSQQTLISLILIPYALNDRWTDVRGVLWVSTGELTN